MTNQIKISPEWKTQKSTILIIPHKETDWKCCFDEVLQNYLELIINILKYQNITLLTHSSINKNYMKKLKLIDKNSKNSIKIFENIEFNDTWARDSLGLVLKTEDHNYAILDFQFNGWGGKFNATLDNQITEFLYQNNSYQDILNRKIEYIKFNNIIEGGALETNGEVLIITKKSILNENRDSLDKQAETEEIFKKYLGIQEILWLESGDLINDDTDSHIDLLVRFANKREILYSDYRTFNTQIDKDVYFSLKNMEKELKAWNKKHSNFYKLIRVPTPIYHQNNEYFPASYLNFIFVNNAIIMPVYDLATDINALVIFKKVFKYRTILQQDSRVFISQGGSFHCLTMQISE
jgi:agmatine deiminase